MSRDTIINLWKLIDRPGTEDIITYLCNTDFFTAPCSVKYHLAKPGGLAEHSMNVFRLLSEKAARYSLQIPTESIIICALGHDLCKVGFYQEGGEPCSKAQYDFLCSLWANKRHIFTERLAELAGLLEADQFKRSLPAAQATILIDWLKNRPMEALPELPVVYSIKDGLPLGHGEKSLSILQDFIKLKDDEKLAIRWHMGIWDVSDYSGKYAFNNAMNATPLVPLLAASDFEANSFLEKEEVDR